ncbi:hypothetical protein [Gordonia alkanivorans]|uniref:hypothetical protein n=1 Tax=Gordonia alkanivorans TaxID=84096 RepID=UPI001F4DFB22|nr:hypothetical protein [Gordonia alkanivorans]
MNYEAKFNQQRRPSNPANSVNRQNAIVLAAVGSVALLTLIGTIAVVLVKSGGGNVCGDYVGKECIFLKQVSDVPMGNESKLWYGYARCSGAADEDETTYAEYYDKSTRFSPREKVGDLKDVADVTAMEIATQLLCPELYP